MHGLIAGLRTLVDWTKDGQTQQNLGTYLAARTLLDEAERSVQEAPDHVGPLLEKTGSLVEELLLTQMHDRFPGSMDSRIEHVRRALRLAKVDGVYCSLMAVYADYAVYSECNYFDYNSEMLYFKAPYTFDEGTSAVTFSPREEVDIHTIVVPKAGAGADADTESENSSDTATTLEVEQDLPFLQTFSTQFQSTEVDDDTGVMTITGIATVGNVLNKAGQIYPTSVWEENMPHLKQLMEDGKLLGESDHPITGKRSIDRTCIKFTELWQQDDEFWFKAQIIPTDPYGKNLQKLLEHGVSIDISSFGYGRTKVQDWKDPKTKKVYAGVPVMQPGFRCEFFDAVVRGASPGATITGWQVSQSDAATDPEEGEMTEAQLKALQEQLAHNAQQQAAATEGLTGSIKELIHAVKGETNPPPTPTPARQDPDPDPGQVALQAELLRAKQMNDAQELHMVNLRIDELVAQQLSAKTWPAVWIQSYKKRLKESDPKTLADLARVDSEVTELIQGMVASAPSFPSNGFTVKKDRRETAPKSGAELIDRLVADLPDDKTSDPLQFLYHDEEGNAHEVPDSIRTPRRQCRTYLRNIMKAQEPGWNGPAAMLSLLRLEQGWDPVRVQDDYLHMSAEQLSQACVDGSTNVGAGGAPTSTIFLFPLVRRVFPQLIATEVASVQPMDRPEGKIFYLDAYRMEGVNSLDEAGDTITNRMRIDRSESFSDSYADDPGECETAKFIQLRLSSKSVTAVTKKLQALWSIEELQDLRAYHGLDAAGELLENLSKEVALEWNQLVLKDMLAGATAGNRLFGTVAPSGYTQKEWDEYLPRYVDAASVDIFRKRNGMMTHIIAGPSAWIKLSSTHRVGTLPSGVNPEQFAGLTLVPFMGVSSPNVKTWMTNFWNGVNSDKILVIRRGQQWSDTPFVWAPYVDYVSPILTTPGSFTQTQGIMSRAARKVVVGDAMATVTIQEGLTGTRL